MKIRLSVLVFLLFATPGVIGALAMAGALSVNLNRGFQDYLTARDQEQLNTLAVRVEEAARERGGLAAFEAGTLTLRMLVPEASGTPRRPPRIPRLGQGRPDAPRLGPERRGSEQPVGRPRPGGLPDRAPPPEGLNDRLAVFSSAGNHLAGPRLPPRMARQTEPVRRDLLIDGTIIGSLSLLPRGPAPEGVDARFLASQYRVAALLAFTGRAAEPHSRLAGGKKRSPLGRRRQSRYGLNCAGTPRSARARQRHYRSGSGDG